MRTINEQIERLRELIRKCYGAVVGKNGTVPEVGERNMENLPQSINTIPVLVEKNDVNFYDYDGTRLFSYTKDEFLSLTELPTVGDIHEDITFEDWTHGLQESQEYVAKYGILDIGSYWYTKDNSIIFRLHTYNDFIAYKTWITSDKSDIIVDWGDGIIETFTSGSDISHHFTDESYKVIRFKAVNNNAYIVQGGIHVDFLKYIEEWNNPQKKCVYYYNTYNYSYSLQKLSISKLCGESRFSTRLKHVIVPRTYQVLNQAETVVIPFNRTYDNIGLTGLMNARRVCLPDGITHTHGLSDAYSMSEIVLPNSISLFFNSLYLGNVPSLDIRNLQVTTVKNNLFTSEASPLDVYMPKVATAIEYVAPNTHILRRVVIYGNVNTIAHNAFTNSDCDFYIYIKDVSKCVLGSNSPFRRAKTIHVLPSATYVDSEGNTHTGIDAFEHATNWSAYAGKYIADADEYDFGQND